jgi:hypothetical protein
MPIHSLHHLATLKATQFRQLTKWDFITKPFSFQFITITIIVVINSSIA